MKKFISLLAAMACVLSLSMAVFAEEKLSNYEKSQQMMPFTTHEIPQAVKDVAGNYMSLCGLTNELGRTAYSIDLENALIAYNGINASGEHEKFIDYNNRYYQFNIGYMLDGNLSVTNQMVISSNGTDAKFVKCLDAGFDYKILREDGFTPTSYDTLKIYEANLLFNQYLQSINCTNTPVLAYDNECYFIYEPLTQSILRVNDTYPIPSNYLQINEAIFNMTDARKFIATNPAYTMVEGNPARDLSEVLSQIEPVYGQKVALQVLNQNPATDTISPVVTVAPVTEPVVTLPATVAVANVKTGDASSLIAVCGIAALSFCGVVCLRKKK